MGESTLKCFAVLESERNVIMEKLGMDYFRSLDGAANFVSAAPS